MREMNIRPFSGGALFDGQVLRLFGLGHPRLVHLWPDPWALEKRPKWKSFRHFRPEFIDLGVANFDEPDPRESYESLSRLSLASELEVSALKCRREPDSHLVWAGQMARRAAARTVPERVRELITGRFSDRHYHAVSLIARCPGAGELLEISPALFYAASSSWVFRANSWPMRAIRELLRRRPRELAQWLGFPKEGYRTLARVATMNLRITGYLYLRDAMRDERLLRRLCFCPRITPLLVRIVSDRAFAPRVSQKFLLECSEMGGGPEDVRENVNTLRDTLELLAAAGRGDGLVFESWAHLERVHREMLGEREEREVIPWLPPIPPPPFPGLKEEGVIDIAPLTCAEDIVNWNRALGRLCIESVYLPLVARGKGYLYRISFPEAACLYVEPVNGKYRNRQLRGKCNNRVLPKTEIAVRGFLKLRNNGGCDI